MDNPLSVKHDRIAEIVACGLDAMLQHSPDLQAALTAAVETVYRLTNCEHIFLNRYDPSAKTFSAYAWRSTLQPGIVPLDQKFMGDSYSAKQTVHITDLQNFNYRLRSSAARLGLKSMIGIPLQGRSGLLGALEVFSREQNYFSQEHVGSLSIIARQASLLIELDNQVDECKLWAIENDFLHDLHASDQSSPGTLLYRLGEAMANMFTADSIAVFGIEPDSEYEVLQEVMAKGFTAQDVTLLKKAIPPALMDKLRNRTGFSGEKLFIKHSFGSIPDTNRVMTLAPVAWRGTLHGLIICYNKFKENTGKQAQAEQFAARMIDYAASTLNRKSMYNVIQRISFTDTLTQLPNRRLFDYILNREFEKVKRGKLDLGLLMLDIDHFKRINDQYGHQAGDVILERLGIMLKASFRSIDLPARFGGEEFAVILPDTDQTSAFAAAERFRTDVESELFIAGNCKIRLTISIGVATHSSRPGYGFSDTKAFLYAADQALYQAKQDRNKTVAAGHAN